MSQKPETRFRNRIRPHLNALKNGLVVPIQQVAISGVPDFILCINGVFVGLELKKDDKSEPSDIQLWWLNRISDCGGLAIVCCPENWPEVHKILMLLDSGLPPEDAVDSVKQVEH